MQRFVALFVAALVGCTSQAIDDRAARDAADVRESARSTFLTVTCHDGSRLGPGCGLVTEFVATEDFRTRFRDKKCARMDDAACQQAYQQALDRWMRQRYESADLAEVARICDGAPQDCEGSEYEKRLLESHNRALTAAVIAAEDDIEQERVAEQRRRVNAQWDAALGLYGEIEYLTYKGPKCRSYPSIFGGVTNTICDR
jgi:hypothetical protein